MDFTGYSISHYRNWDFVPITIISVVVGGGAIVLATLNIITSWCCKKVLCEDMVFGASGLLLDFEVTTDHQGNKEATSHARTVPPLVIHFLFVLAAFFFVCSCVTFWDTFLVEESFGCNPELDCFPVQENDRSTVLSPTPIQNCSDYELMDDVTTVCYRFVFRYAEGFGAAGGILYLAIKIMKMYETALFWAVDSEVTESCLGCIKKAMKWIVWVIVLFSPAISCIVILDVSQHTPIIYNTIFMTKSDIERFVVYYLTYVFVATGGIYSLFTLTGVTKQKQKHMS